MVYRRLAPILKQLSNYPSASKMPRQRPGASFSHFPPQNRQRTTRMLDRECAKSVGARNREAHTTDHDYRS